MGSLPPNPSTIHQEKTQENVKHLQTGQHLGDDADQYTDSLLSHFKSGGTRNMHSHTIRHFANTRSLGKRMRHCLPAYIAFKLLDIGIVRMLKQVIS